MTKQLFPTSYITNNITASPDKYTISRNIFFPSRRTIWEIKSNDNNNHSYFVSFDLNFCSCKGFYYNYKRGKCYHLNKISDCIDDKKYSVGLFSDNQMTDFMRKFFSDILIKNL